MVAHKWWQMDAVETWEAVALSLGVDPEDGRGVVRTASIKGPQEKRLQEEFNTRLKIASSHLNAGSLEQLPYPEIKPSTRRMMMSPEEVEAVSRSSWLLDSPPIITMGGDSRLVRLSTFAAWALGRRPAWKIPVELAALAVPPAMRPPASRLARSTAATDDRNESPPQYASRTEIEAYLRKMQEPNQKVPAKETAWKTAIKTFAPRRVTRSLVYSAHDALFGKQKRGPRANSAK